MGVGLEVYNKSGNKIFDASTSTGRILGSLEIKGRVKGEITHPAFSEGTPFSITVCTTIDGATNGLFVNTQGNKIVYDFTPLASFGNNLSYIISYGVLS